MTTDSSTAGAIQRAGLADIVIAIERRLVGRRLPSDAEFEGFFAPRSRLASIGWMTRRSGTWSSGAQAGTG